MTTFREITDRMNSIYERKNKDYGNTFDQSLNEDGLLVAKIRLKDKVGRFSNLIKDPTKRMVADESVIDTLLDLANYAVMTVAWLENRPLAGQSSEDCQKIANDLLKSTTKIEPCKSLEIRYNTNATDELWK